MSKLHVDLCTGLGGWKEPFEESSAWRSVRVDIRQDLNADIVADIQQLPLDCSPTLLTMSPPCTQFSRYSMPWLDEPNPDLSLIWACMRAVDTLKPRYWVLENVRGFKQYLGVSERKRVGPYYLWGNFPPFDGDIQVKGKMQTGGTEPEERAKIPYALSDALRKAIEWQT